MGASRENHNLYISLKNREWNKFFKDFKILFRIGNRMDRFYNRDLVIMDTFKTPYHNHIGCKIWGHRWSNDLENKKYDFEGFSICWKCYKHISSMDLKSSNRDGLIEKILK